MNEDKYDIVYTDEKGTVRIVGGKAEPSGWYCRCGSHNSYYRSQCWFCKAYRIR